MTNYTLDTLIKRIENGEDSTTIAQELSDMLNKAEATVKKREDQKAKEAERAVTEAKAFTKVREAIIDYFNIVVPEVYNILDDKEKTDLNHIIEEALTETTTMLRAMVPFIQTLSAKKEDKTNRKRSKEFNADQVLADFVKTFENTLH